MIQNDNNPDIYASNDEDVRFIAAFINGDRSAFNCLVNKYMDLVVNLCVQVIGNFADGEDMAQDTFVKVFKNLSKFKGESLFTTWLYRIAVNTSRNFLRSRWRKYKRVTRSLDTSTDEHRSFEIGDTSMLPSKDYERIKTAEKVKASLQALPLKFRELIILRDIQGLSYNEIESILGLSLGTVKSRLARARSAMAQKLGGIRDDT